MKIALIIIYNHRYDKNIDKIEEILKGRFSNIYHVVPFYDGNKENVLTVYESSYYFSGYVAQAYERIKNKDYSHFVFMADDMILNPILNESNILQEIGLNEDESYLEEYIFIGGNDNLVWPRIPEGFLYNPKQAGLEILNIIPQKEDALSIFNKHGVKNFESIHINKIYANVRKAKYFHYIIWVLKLIKQLAKEKSLNLKFNYPLVGSYSDFFIVPKQYMPKFCQYSGAFAASNLFVELAIPTALVLSSGKIKTGKNCRLNGTAYWGKDIENMCRSFNYSLIDLEENFPQKSIYVHPVKLSKWK